MTYLIKELWIKVTTNFLEFVGLFFNVGDDNGEHYDDDDYDDEDDDD